MAKKLDEDFDTKERGTRFAEMSTQKKLLFVLKLAVCIITFGIAFPNVMSD